MPIYNQRWLREHNAVPTDKGWKRSNTNELLKCQKGLNVIEPDQPIFKSSLMIDTPKIVIINEDTNEGVFKYKYEIDEHDYIPMNINPTSIANSNKITYVINEKEKEITGTLKTLVDGEQYHLQLFVEGVVSRNLYQICYTSIDFKNPSFNKVDIYKHGGYFNSNTKIGYSYAYYRVYDTILSYEKDDIELEIEYSGNATIVPKIRTFSSTSNIIDIAINGSTKNGEVFYLTVKVKGVSSEKTKLTIIHDTKVITPEDIE